MNYTDLVFKIPVDKIDEASAIATAVCPMGFYVEDYSDLEQTNLNEMILNKDRTTALIHIYISEENNIEETLSFMQERLKACKIEFSVNTSNAKEEEWSNAWKKYYHSIELDDKLAICPSWETYNKKPNQYVLYLDPGMAFGSGTHETTRLCLSLVEKYLKEGNTMLDVGTGSGILALGARLLGAKEALGIDIDLVAVKTAKENAKLNSIDNVEFIAGNLADDVNGTFDIITANIVADAIISLSKDLPKLMDKNSVCIVSGIIDVRSEEVVKALNKQGLNVIDKKEESGWIALALKK